jgi:hypothetical protein
MSLSISVLPSISLLLEIVHLFKTSQSTLHSSQLLSFLSGVSVTSTRVLGSLGHSQVSWAHGELLVHSDDRIIPEGWEPGSALLCGQLPAFL